MKRWILFIATNILVIATITILLNLLGIHGYITAKGIDMRSLMIFCLVWGMGGSFISLALSRQMAKWLAGVQVIDPNKPGEYEWLVRTVHQIAKKAGIQVMPEVGVYNSPEVNAFATGPTKNRALVAVSAGLLRSMTNDEIEGVLAHEITHVQNGDMVTMTLLQGVINAFVMFFARVASFAIAQNVDEGKRPWVRFFCTIFFQMALGILGLIVVDWFSRQREFRADSGSAKLLGSAAQMKAALQKLALLQGRVISDKSALGTMKISSESKSKFGTLFATHPALEERIAALGV
jgi:heat shock protein HtpX